MADWFRSWHGAPMDAKWLLIADKSGTSPVVVSAVAWALLDHASQHEDRGCVADFDTETYAVWADVDESAVVAIIDAMTDKRIIVDGHLANWEKRQPQREDDSTARTRAYRDRKQTVTAVTRGDVTQCDAVVTQCDAPEESKRRVDTETDTEAETGEEYEAREALPAAAVQTASVLCQASWIGGDEAAIGRSVCRAFGLVPAFSQQDGPLEAEKFARYHARQPPKDWYRAWLNWLKNAVRFRYADHAPVAGRRGRIPDYDGINAVADAMTREGL